MSVRDWRAMPVWPSPRLGVSLIWNFPGEFGHREAPLALQEARAQARSGRQELHRREVSEPGVGCPVFRWTRKRAPSSLSTSET